MQTEALTQTLELEEVSPLEAAIAETRHPPIPEGYRELPAGVARWVKVNRRVMGEAANEDYFGLTCGRKNVDVVIEVYTDLDEDPDLYGDVIIDGPSQLEVRTGMVSWGCGPGNKVEAINGVAIRTVARLLVK